MLVWQAGSPAVTLNKEEVLACIWLYRPLPQPGPGAWCGYTHCALSAGEEQANILDKIVKTSTAIRLGSFLNLLIFTCTPGENTIACA